LLACGLVLAVGTFTALLSRKIGIPDVALFLIAGMLIGPEVLGLINIRADSPLNQIIILFGASYILFDGGASLRFNVLKQVWITIVVIATAGVLITAGITEQSAAETLTLWDTSSWRDSAVEYHRNRRGCLAVEIDPKRLARLRALMVDGVSLERAWHELYDFRTGICR